MNRRHFLRSATLAGAAPFVLTRRSAFAEDIADAGVRRVGLIGSGWYGKCDLFRLMQVAPVDVVALCDPDRHMLEDAGEQVAARQASRRPPRLHADYREMLAEKDLDLVLVDSPDHWHALQTIAAIQAGADVYVQKPTGVDVVESQAMLAAARKHERVVQVGTQRRSTAHLAEAIERVIRPGLLGKVSHVEIFCYYHMRRRGNPPQIPVPDHLDFDLWTGPAPLLPYNEIIHPRGWRAFMEYGNGIVGDMCVHMLDMVRWMLDLGWPRHISSSGGIFQDPDSLANITDTQTAIFGYDDLNVVWTHRSWGDPPDPQYPWGAVIYGERGTLKASVHRYDFIPRGDGRPLSGEVEIDFTEFPEDRTERDLEHHVAEAIREHMRDFLRAVDSRGRPVADIREGHISSSACVLANLALDLGRTLHWDEEADGVRSDDEANRLLRRPYREPWIHPEVGDL